MDRKGWTILIICGILLALNFAFMPKKPQQTETTPDPKESAATSATSTPEVADTQPEEPQPGLTREAHIPEVGEKTATLTSQKDGKNQVLFTFTSNGGGIKTAELLNQMAIGSSTEHIVLNTNSPAPIGAIGEGADEFLALHYKLIEQEMENAIYAEASTATGLKITKRWSLEENLELPGAPWRLNLKITFTNQSKTTTNLSNYSLFAGTATPLHPREWENQGGAFFLNDGSFTNNDSNKFKKGFFSKGKDLIQESAGELEYAGVSNQFFATIVSPANQFPSTVWAKTSKVDLPGGDPEKPKFSIRSGFALPSYKLAEKESVTYDYSVYIGPKRYSVLKKMAGDVKEVMNYGWFSFVSVPLNNVLNWLHDSIFVHVANKWSWGLAVIALTILIRICIWPLHNKSTRTMKRMSKLQPLMKDMREKYKDDPNKLNQETMKLYKEYQVNPMGGCLPMFLQIPIFFGYYKMLQFAVELRGHGFLWVEDLSMPDTLYTINLPFELPMLGSALPVNILPILMAVTMVLQMKMTPKTGDKMQQRMMMFMPFMFFFFCYNFASALALYWTTQNIFSIGQTWFTNRLPEPELAKRKVGKTGGKKTFMERMAERVETQKSAQTNGDEKPMRNATPDDKKPSKKRNPKTGG
jgi:YidC/Oxa1 family membrane protein insertase